MTVHKMSGHNPPNVSIIIPVYNDEKRVAEAIESALAQTLKDVEVIVVDDGSTDGTREVIRRYEEQIVHIRQKNSGPAVARNAGIRAAKGKYVCFLDSDDLVTPGKCAVQVDFLDRHGEYGLCAGSWREVFEHSGKSVVRSPRLPKEWPDGLVFHLPWAANAALVRREWLDLVEGHDERLRSMEDMNLWWRLARAGCRFGFVNDVVAIVHKRRGSITSDPKKGLESTLTILESYFCDGRNEKLCGLTRPERYAHAWAVAGAGFFRVGNRSEAVEAWVKALEWDPAVFKSAPRWWLLILYSYPDYPRPDGSSASSLSSICVGLRALLSEAHSKELKSGAQVARRTEEVCLRLGACRSACTISRGWHSRLWLARAFAVAPLQCLRLSGFRQLARVSLGPTLVRLVRQILTLGRRHSASQKNV